MPRFDGTGPEGKGATTGRGRGNCESRVLPEIAEEAKKLVNRRGTGLGRGQGLQGQGIPGRGRGCGRRRCWER